MTGEACSELIRRGYADTDVGQLHYRYTTASDKPVLLLLHQSPSASSMYEALMAELADDFYCLAPDTPGFGNSDAHFDKPLGDVTISDYSAAIKQFLGTLGVSTCTVFGHHTGAAIAVQLEYDFPGTASALVLSGPTLLSGELKAALPARAAPFPQAEDGSHLTGMWDRIRGKDDSVELALSQRETLLALGSGDHYQQAYIACTLQKFDKQLASLGCPTLAFAASGDLLLSCVAPTLERLKNGSTVDFGPGTSYICDLEASRLAATIREFVVAKCPI